MAPSDVGSSTASDNDSPFLIISTSSAKLDAAARKQVRSHVMRGKNRKPHNLHNSRVPRSWINGRQLEGAEEDGRQKAANHDLQCIPQRVGDDMSHITFADEMKPYMINLAFHFFTVLKQAMHPVEACIQPSFAQWVDYLAYDRAYVHSVLFTTQAYFDFIRYGQFSNTTMHHLGNSLKLLRENLTNDKLATSDSTIGTVLTLVLMADILEDYEAARKHMQGLYQLVDFRGGIRALRHNSELQVKVLRADLGLALSMGSKPLFFCSGFSWEPYLLPSCSSTSTNAQSSSFSATKPSPPRGSLSPYLNIPSNPRLQNVAQDLAQFSLSANLAFQTGLKIPAQSFRETLVSVQYRLLALQHELEDVRSPPPSQEMETGSESTIPTERVTATETETEKLLRLGMLAFTTTTFLKVKEIPMPYHDLARRVRRVVDAMDTESGGEGEGVMKLRLWFLFVARISVLDRPVHDETLVRTATAVLQQLGLTGPKTGWSEVRDVLRAYMWIDWVHSEMGKAFYEELAKTTEP